MLFSSVFILRTKGVIYKKRILSAVLLVFYLTAMLPIHASALEPLDETIIPNGSTVPMKAIVIIPGLLGSTLYQGGTRVWLNDNESVSMEKLALTETGTSVYTVTSVSDYGVRDTYRALYNNLYNAFDPSGYDIIFFDYDWRLNTTYTASLLTSELANYSEVILVAHSMGGLVASKFLASSAANRNKTVAVFTLGTPFAGSAKTMQAMETGERRGFMNWLTAVQIILYWCSIPMLIQLVFCLLFKSGWIRAIPIILSSLFWLANFIMAFLFQTPLLREFATYHMMTGLLVLSDQILIASLHIFAIPAQALVWLIVSLIQWLLRRRK